MARLTTDLINIDRLKEKILKVWNRDESCNVISFFSDPVDAFYITAKLDYKHDENAVHIAWLRDEIKIETLTSDLIDQTNIALNKALNDRKVCFR